MRQLAFRQRRNPGRRPGSAAEGVTRRSRVPASGRGVMSEGSALDPRELLRLLAEQQANISQLQRLVIEHVLAEAGPEAIAVAPCSPTTSVPTRSEPMPAIVVARMPSEAPPAGGSGVTANEPEQAPATMPDSNAESVDAPDESVKTVRDAAAASGASDQPAPPDSPFGEA